MGVPFGNRQQTSPLGSPQPLPSPGNPANEMAVSTSIYAVCKIKSVRTITVASAS